MTKVYLRKKLVVRKNVTVLVEVMKMFLTM